MLISSVTPADIASSLGRDPYSGVELAQVQTWINDATYLISLRADKIGLTVDDLEALDYVVRQAVLAVADPAVESQSVQVDDGMVTTRYGRTPERTPRRVSILAEWWTMLGLNEGDGRAFSIHMTPTSYANHLPWCDIMLGGATCSCGASLAGYPIYEA